MFASVILAASVIALSWAINIGTLHATVGTDQILAATLAERTVSAFMASTESEIADYTAIQTMFDGNGPVGTPLSEMRVDVELTTDTGVPAWPASGYTESIGGVDIPGWKISVIVMRETKVLHNSTHFRAVAPPTLISDAPTPP